MSRSQGAPLDESLRLVEEADMFRHGIGDVSQLLVALQASDHNTASVLSQTDSLEDGQDRGRV